MNSNCYAQLYKDHDEFNIDSIKYNNNGVKIIASPESMNYIIETDNWYIYWYVSPDNELQIFNRYADKFKCILTFKKNFDMSYFAVIDNNLNSFNKINIIYSSADLIDKQIKKLLNLKVFI